MSDAPASHIPDPVKHPVKHGKAAGKGLVGKLKGHNKYVYIAGAVILIGVAWMAWHRSTSGDVADTGDDTLDTGAYDDTSTASYGSSGDSGGGVSPAATQGAYGGSDQYYDPTDQGQPLEDAVGPDSPDAVVQVQFGAIPTVKQKATNKTAAKKKKAHPTGGGTTPKRDAAKKFHPADPRSAAAKAHKKAENQQKAAVAAAKKKAAAPKKKAQQPAKKKKH